MNAAEFDNGRTAKRVRAHALEPSSLPYLDRLYRAAWGMCGSCQEAEDLAQETLARVLARPQVLRGDDDLRYLLRALRNTFHTSHRRPRARSATAAGPSGVAAADPNPSSRRQPAPQIREVYASIAELPESMRLALVGVDILGLTHRQAARALRLREGTVTTRLLRARARLAAGLLAPCAHAARARTVAHASTTHS